MKITERRFCESWLDLDLPADFAGEISAGTVLAMRPYMYRPQKKIFTGVAYDFFSDTSLGTGEEILKNYNYLHENLQEILILSDLLDPTKGDFKVDIKITIWDDKQKKICGEIKQKYSYEGDLC